MYYVGLESDIGLSGTFIVREELNPYDYDLRDHVLLLTEWNKTILINGFYSNSLKLHVFPNKSYRFRIAYSGGPQNDPIKFSIENHLLKIIAIDGNYVENLNLTEFVITCNGRIDFILITNQIQGNFSIGFSSLLDQCGNDVKGNAILIYDTHLNKQKLFIEDSKNNGKKMVLRKFGGMMNEKFSRIVEMEGE